MVMGLDDGFIGVLAVTIFALTGLIMYLILQSWLSTLCLPFWGSYVTATAYLPALGRRLTTGDADGRRAVRPYHGVPLDVAADVLTPRDRRERRHLKCVQ
jgi:hypothetical protein